MPTLKAQKTSKRVADWTVSFLMIIRLYYTRRIKRKNIPLVLLYHSYGTHSSNNIQLGISHQLFLSAMKNIAFLHS